MRWVSGRPVWTQLTPIPVQYRYLAEDLSADVVIIGGGITGALTAYCMAKAGIRAAVLDRGPVGYNSTRTSTAILQYEIDTNLLGLQGLYGTGKAVRAFKLCEEAVAAVGQIVRELDDPCDFRPVPCLYYTESPSDVEQMRREFELRQAHGFAVAFRGRTALPVPCEAGIYSTRGAAVIDPYRFTHALLRYAAEHGVTIYENTEVTEISPGEKEVRMATANGFRIRAGRVVVASGYAAREYIEQRTALLTRSFAIVTRPVPEVPGWRDRCIIRDNKQVYTYLRPMPGERILIGGEDLDVGSDRSAVAQLSGDDPISDRQYRRLLERLNRLFPILALTEDDIEFRFSGIFADTKDSLPYIGPYDPMPGCLFNLGYGANGILYNLIGGRLLTELCLGRPSPDLELFAFDR
ncbi:MAG TPA: FAD-dependent oxidoreductase [Symbiobacteriaceae bacterium]|nr:FAD-dependent oxidoreductase [Symbiobacteriaceae bacterium]